MQISAENRKSSTVQFLFSHCFLTLLNNLIMRKITVILSAILFILSFNSVEMSAQNTSEKRWNVAAGYSTFHKTIHDGAYEFESYFPRLGITTNYQVNELFHIGLGLGYSPKYIIVEPEKTYTNDLSLFAWWLNTKFQLLPMLINNANSPFILYLSGKNLRVKPV